VAKVLLEYVDGSEIAVRSIEVIGPLTMMRRCSCGGQDFHSVKIEGKKVEYKAQCDACKKILEVYEIQAPGTLT
jgi:hypothetical protein